MKSIDWDHEEDEEEEEVPDDLSHLKPEEQQHRIKVRAVTQLAAGVIMSIIFSDPMVDAFTEVGNRTVMFQYMVFYSCDLTCTWFIRA